MPRIYWKYHPRNPNAIVYNFNWPLLEVPARLFHPGADSYEPAWMAALANLPGIVEVRMSRFKLLIKKARERRWAHTCLDIDAIVREVLNADEIQDHESGPDRQQWPLSAPATASLIVYASPAEATESLLARKLFQIPGVAEVILRPETVTIVKGKLFAWEELAPHVDATLGNRDNDRTVE